MRKIFSFLLIITMFLPTLVNAESNYNTSYYITIPESGALNQTYGTSEHTYKEAFDSIINTETSNYFMILTNIRNGEYDTKFRMITILISTTYPSVNNTPYLHLNASNTRFYYYNNSITNTFKYKSFNTTAFTDDAVTEIKACISDYSTCSWSTMSNIESYTTPSNYTNVTNDSDFSFSLKYASSTYTWPIYSNFNLTIGTPTTSQLENTSYYFKNIYVNDIEIKEGMSIPTYYDLYYPPEPEPDEPDEPVNPDEPVDPDEPTFDNFTSWIYWFSEPTDSNSLLNNIYTLLFLYCFTMIILKLYTIIKVKK